MTGINRRQMFKLAAMSAVVSLTNLSLKDAIASEQGAEWGYVGENNPSEWDDLSPEYQACGAGMQQSPIDLHEGIAVDMANVSVHYQSVPLRIVNNGHAIQINTDPGSYILIDGERYDLLQFHFHHPSEHTVEGETMPMEAHFVHKNAAGNLAVLGVLLKEGAENRVLKPIWDAMPRQPSAEDTIPGVNIDIAQLLPADQSTYRYFGSLTTPPCSEIVKWVMFQTPTEVSPAQIGLFSDIFPLNARPVQPLNRRFLLVDD
ncbi:MAG: carbonic anhydrase [Thainema sp.]